MLRFPKDLTLNFLCTATLFSTAYLVSGCGSTDTAAPGDLAIPAMHGGVRGGQQPVVGATIQLYAVGLPSSGGGYGSGQASQISSTVTTDGSGDFNITDLYHCPANSYVYITAMGGKPVSGQTNSALALMTALGPCANLSSSTVITINEATTVAGVWALQQFTAATFGTAGSFSIGAPSTNITGLQNAFATAKNLVSPTTGLIPASTVASSTVNGATVNVTILNEQAKIGTLANILAACINSVDISSSEISATCTSLFNSVKPAGQTDAPADTLQAALDMARNPTNVGSTTTPPYNLSSSTAPFQPSLSAPPTDYTLGLDFGSTTVLGVTGTQSYFLYTPISIAIDSNGNVYSLNGPAAATSTPYNSISVVAPSGAPVASFYGGTLLNQPRGIALDTSNNIWIANQATTTPANALIEFTQAGATNNYTFASGLYGIAIDGHNNVFVGSNAAQQVVELAAGATALHGLGTATGPEFLAIDANNNIWSVGFSVTSAYKFAATCTTTCTFAAPVSFTGLSSPFGVAIDSNNIPWVSQPGSNNLVMLAPATPANGGTATAAKLGGLNTPKVIASDGAGNIWAANNSPASVTELQTSSTTVALSPSAGFTHTYNAPSGIAIDMSGNVWVGNNGATNASGSYALTEIVGAASPAVQPLSRAASLGKIGQLP